VSNILRLCIRKLHETLLESDNNALLTKAEKKFLSLAYYRAAYKFSIQQDASAETLKHIEAQVGWSIKFGNFLPTSAGNVFPSLLPNLDTSTKASKEWHKKVGSTIALLDYDEDRAEDDIVDLIKMLASSQLPSTRRERLKLVFVFDEMDKMAKEEQINLVSQLKNLFLARYAVFLLVTSKDFYYLWLEERKKEDAVLASYFSGIKSVPLFTSKETTALIERLIAIDNVPSLRTNDRTFISSVAQYLTYRARGVPRDIVREMQAIQKWTKEGLQPYITSRSEQYNTILIYAQLQLVLERVLDNTSGSLIPPAIATTSMTGSTDSQIPEVASTLHYEHIWTNEGRHEQVRQGLYILIEELLDLGGLEINPDSEILKRLREENFKMVSPNDFKTLLNRLISQLESVPLPNAPGNTPIEPNAVSEIKLFSIAAPENGFKVVQVAESFYQITGRSVSSPDSSRAQIATVYSLDKIREMLKREEFLPRRRALSALQQNVQTLPVDINMLLCRLFIGVNNSPTVRRDAVSLLQGSNACLTIFEVEKEALNRFLLSEVDTQLLQEFMRLVTGALSSDSSKRHEGAAMLLQLLARYKPEEVDDVQMISLKRTEPLYGEIIANLAKMPDEDVLDACVSSLNRRDDVPGDVLPSLIDMAKRYDRNLLELFANLDFNAVSADTLQTILKTMTYRQLMDTWSSVISRKQQPFAQQILAAILQQRSIYSSSSPETNTIAEWLNSPQPDAIDRRIIAAALAASPAIRSLLEKMIKEENKGRLADSKPDATSSTSTSGPGFRVSGGAIAFMVVLAALIAYATVPFDLPPRDTIVQHLVARTLELVYVYSGVAALVILGFLIFTRSNSVALIISFVITSVLTAAGLYFQIVSFPLAMTFLGQVFLVGLLLVIVVAFGVWMFFSDVVPNVV